MTRREFGAALAGFACSLRGPGSLLQGPGWKTGKLVVPGGRIVWKTLGNGTHPPLLLVHGGPSGASSKPFEAMSPLARGRRLVTWDQLDAGESDHPGNPENWRLARYVKELDLVREHLAPGPVHVLGGSWGSSLVMEWLVTNRPADVVSVIFLCPTLDSARAERSRRNAQMQLSPASRQAFEDAARNPNRPSPALAAANAEYVRTFIMRHGPPGIAEGPPDPAMLQALGRDMRSWDRSADLATLTQPVLFVRGEFDYVTAEDVAAYAAARPGSQAVTIPDAAHLAFIDNPDRTNDAIRQFLDRVERG